MARIKILASGSSPQDRAQKRGELFEKLMTHVLKSHGYVIDKLPSVNYAGMEIDIEGKSTIADIPIYAECKCYDTLVDSKKIQSFFGNYMTRWLRNRKCQGLFVALPGINSHAKGYYRENCEGNSEITIKLFEEEQVIDAIIKAEMVARPSMIAESVHSRYGAPGDQVILYTELGPYWLQYVIPKGSGLATQIALFDASGTPLTDQMTVNRLVEIMPELNDFEIIYILEGAPYRNQGQDDLEQIVEVRGSSSCFEYQFPASPDHFVGRERILLEVDSFADAVLRRSTSARGIVFEANSGWGKSSIVLASVSRLRQKGHYAVAVDSRSASSSKFILKVIEYVLREIGNLGGSRDVPIALSPQAITGFDGAIDSLTRLGRELEKHYRLLFIFLDQFENIFFLSDVLSRIQDLLLRICDIQTNVVLGFSWKTDLIGLASEFPYKLRDTIVSLSRHIPITEFSEPETTALLDRLSLELRARLRKDLRFLLSEFSQGYPWLLKRLCAHVKSQRESGVSQSDIALGLLNIEELFKDDLRGLSPREEDTLRGIARQAPISFSQLSEEFDADVLQSLLNRRLVVRIGNKYDVYWDIFRDFLNSNRIPVQENYVIRLQVATVLRATRVLAEAGKCLSIEDLQQKTLSSQKTVYNIVREMRILGLAAVGDGQVRLILDMPDSREAEEAVRTHLRDRLKRNRLVWKVTTELESVDTLTIDDIAHIIQKSCPYISATMGTWETYARILVDWLNYLDLAVVDSKTGMITRYRPEVLRERRLLLSRRRRSIMFPTIQFAPIMKVLTRIYDAIQSGSSEIDWTGLKRSTIYKSLSVLDYLEFVRRRSQTIELLPKGTEFVRKPNDQIRVFAQEALKMTSFREFVNLLNKYRDCGKTLKELAEELKDLMGLNWTIETGKTNIKIMLDWARHLGLAPGVFTETRKGQFKARNRNQS